MGILVEIHVIHGEDFPTFVPSIKLKRCYLYLWQLWSLSHEILFGCCILMFDLEAFGVDVFQLWNRWKAWLKRTDLQEQYSLQKRWHCLKNRSRIRMNLIFSKWKRIFKSIWETWFLFLWQRAYKGMSSATGWCLHTLAASALYWALP